jgi:hypothetical protein
MYHVQKNFLQLIQLTTSIYASKIIKKLINECIMYRKISSNWFNLPPVYMQVFIKILNCLPYHYLSHNGRMYLTVHTYIQVHTYVHVHIYMYVHTYVHTQDAYKLYPEIHSTQKSWRINKTWKWGIEHIKCGFVLMSLYLCICIVDTHT